MRPYISCILPVPNSVYPPIVPLVPTRLDFCIFAEPVHISALAVPRRFHDGFLEFFYVTFIQRSAHTIYPVE